MIVGLEHRPHAEWSSAFANILHEIGYGVILIDENGEVLYANGIGHAELRASERLAIVGGVIAAAHPDQSRRLARAIDQASKGRRLLIALGHESPQAAKTPPPPEGVKQSGRATFACAYPQAARTPPSSEGGQQSGSDTSASGREPGVFAFIPMGTPGAARILILCGRDEPFDPSTLLLYAKVTGLTSSECEVLALLCRGVTTHDIASCRRVKLSTVRSQISSIRAKFGVRSVMHVITKVSGLPPTSQRLLSPFRQAHDKEMRTCRVSAPPSHQLAPAAGTLESALSP